MISEVLKIRAVIIMQAYPTKQLAVERRQIAQRIHSRACTRVNTIVPRKKSALGGHVQEPKTISTDHTK